MGTLGGAAESTSDILPAVTKQIDSPVSSPCSSMSRTTNIVSCDSGYETRCPFTRSPSAFSSRYELEKQFGPLLSEQKFILIFISFMERALCDTISADISNLITLFVGSSKLDWFNNKLRKSHPRYYFLPKLINRVTIIKESGGGRPSTVLFGDAEPLDSSRYTKYEIVFMINKMKCGFSIGYVIGSIRKGYKHGDINWMWELGWRQNGEKSVGIYISANKFFLNDRYHTFKQLECEAENGPSTFPERGQIWRVSWDLIDNEMEISVLNQREMGWIRTIHYAMNWEHCDVIPAISLGDKDDSITLL